MKPHPFVLLLLLVVASPSLAAEQSDARVAVIANLYREFAWEAVISTPESGELGLLDQPRQVLQRYFTPEITELILRDRSTAEQTGEVPRLDFLPLWDSQDPAAVDLRITLGSSPNSVLVTFSRPNSASLVRISYRLSKLAVGWRISDIEYSGGHSLAEIVRGSP